jgi:phage-related protein
VKKIRNIVTYRDYFTDFLRLQPPKLQDKIMKVMEIIETVERIPERYFKHIQNGLFEIRVQLGSDNFRIFCFFDAGKLIILLTGFQKKTEKTPPREIKRAMKLMKEYYKEKEDKK